MIEKKFNMIISMFREILFKNKDIISGRELVGEGIVSEETENRLENLKKLRKLNNIYYIWDYNEEFKKLIFSYKYSRKKSLAKLILNVKYIEIKRIKNTEKMHKLLNEKLREENIRGSFKIDNSFNFKNKKILLVDDIITTGATLKEIKNSILDNIDEKNIINSKNRKNTSKTDEKAKITVFCLAAAREIKINKGEV